MEHTTAKNNHMTFTDTALTYLDFAQEALTEVLWPTRCVLCDEPGVLLCETCQDNLEFIDFYHRCPCCGAPWGGIQCTECNPVILNQFGLRKPPFSACVSVLHFTSSTARIVRSFKDQNEQRLGKIIASYMKDILPPSWFLPPTPSITFIPATKKAFRRRGFDHSELIAQNLACATGVPLLPLFERPLSKDQRTLNRQQRIVNIENRFTLLEPKNIPPRVLLVDDVYTTGATLYAASQTLKEGGCKEIFCITFARVW